MKVDAVDIEGPVKISELPKFMDARGEFQRIFCGSSFGAEGLNFNIRQINLSRTVKKGALRGLHFQYGPSAEDKLITCVNGRIFDVAVDLRRSSANFGKWHAVELSGDTSEAYLIPKGFAHGFQSLTPDVEMIYLMSEDYNPSMEGGVHYACKNLKIDWPLAVTEISDRDKDFPSIVHIDLDLFP